MTLKSFSYSFFFFKESPSLYFISGEDIIIDVKVNQFLLHTFEDVSPSSYLFESNIFAL